LNEISYKTERLQSRRGPQFSKTSFFKEVYQVVRRIPPGKVLTYGQIATLVGAPHMARQVGWAMHGCPAGLPWQRVVGAGGKILINSMSSGEGPFLQRKLLELEGVHFSGKYVDMKIHQFRPPKRSMRQKLTSKSRRRATL
jgi:methylated-DNA-protein-cysteine methyltransferase-like protein